MVNAKTAKILVTAGAEANLQILDGCGKYGCLVLQLGDANEIICTQRNQREARQFSLPTAVNFLTRIGYTKMVKVTMPRGQNEK